MDNRTLITVASALLIASCATSERSNSTSVQRPQTATVATTTGNDSIVTLEAMTTPAAPQLLAAKSEQNNQTSKPYYDFFEVVESALNHDFDYAIARENYQAAKLDFKLVKRGYLPDVTARYDVAKNDDDDPNTRESRLSATSITIEQSLFDPTVNADWRIARLKRAQSEAELAAARDVLLTKVISAYIKALRSEADVVFRSDDLIAIKEQIRESRTLLQLGEITSIDVSEIEAQSNLAVSTLLQAEDTAFKDKGVLFDLTGLDSEPPIAKLKTHLRVGPLQPTSVEDWVSTSLKNNTQIIASELAITAQKARERLPYAKHIPSIQLEGRAVNPIETDDDITNTNTTIELSVTMSLFDRGRTNASIAREQAATRIAQNQTQLMQRKITRQIRDNYKLAISSIARTKANIRAVDAFTDAEKSIASGFDLGVRTALDLLTARRSKLQSENLLVNAHLDYLQSALLLRLDANLLNDNELRKFNQFFTHDN